MGCLALHAWVLGDDSLVDGNGSFLERLVATGGLRVRLLIIVRLDRICIESLHGNVVADLLVYHGGPIAGSERLARQVDDVCDSSRDGGVSGHGAGSAITFGISILNEILAFGLGIGLSK